jgi:hypothetical protein
MLPISESTYIHEHICSSAKFSKLDLRVWITYRHWAAGLHIAMLACALTVGR